MESLGLGLRHQQLEPFLMTIAANARSTEDLITHPGQEFVYCIQGEFDYRIAEQLYHLEAGDSLLFEATVSHYFCNRGALPAVA